MNKVITVSQLENTYNISSKNNMLSIEEKSQLLKSICNTTIEPIKKFINKNIINICNGDDFDVISAMSFKFYTNLELYDTSVFYKSTNDKDYYDIILIYKNGNNGNNDIYIRWDDEFKSLDEKPITKNLNFTPEYKNKKVVQVLNKYLDKFLSGMIFNNLEELYQYIETNCIGRRNSKILKSIKLEKKTINDIILNRCDTNLIEILEINNTMIPVSQIIKLDKILYKSFRIDLNIHYREIKKIKNVNLNVYKWNEIGSIVCIVKKYTNEYFSSP